MLILMQKLQDSKFPRVPEDQLLRAGFERRHEVIMFLSALTSIYEQNPAAHAQMYQELAAGREFGDNVLAAPVEVHECLSDQCPQFSVATFQMFGDMRNGFDG